MAQGKVKWYNDTKGFGFIEIEDGNDVFVHRTGLADSFRGLDEGQEVTFELKEADKGPMAVDVRVVE